MQHATIVYYSNGDHYGAEAFFVANIGTEKLQKAFDENDIHTIKCITVETESFASKKHKTIWMERDIQDFLKQWEIDF